MHTHSPQGPTSSGASITRQNSASISSTVGSGPGCLRRQRSVPCESHTIQTGYRSAAADMRLPRYQYPEPSVLLMQASMALLQHMALQDTWATSTTAGTWKVA